jgi:murein DD-endopeptidase MepM/ murein hydrolase activator NlpD
MRRSLAALAALVLGVVLAHPASAAPSRSEAQARANRAAQRLAAAQTELAQLEQDLSRLESEAAEAKQRLAVLSSDVRDLAISQYVSGRLPTLSTFDGDIGKVSRGQAMARHVAHRRTDSIDAYRAAAEEFEENQAALAEKATARKAKLASLEKERKAAYSELQKIVKAEQEAAAKLAAEREAAARRSAERSRPPARQATRGSTATAGPTGQIASGDWVCPVQGPRSVSNDWGQPRSGGRRHQGNDILSPRGTPVVASVSGTVRHHNSSLGGLSYYLNGDDGVTYFGTHLSGYAASGRVKAGTVVGYVGDTGNARGTPHLHFEMHPGGGAAVNPYPTLSKYC